MTPASAEILALKALGFLANSGDAADRFLAASGADPIILQELAGDPEFLAAVVDFLLSDEALLVQFCEAEMLDPRTMHSVRHALPGG